MKISITTFNSGTQGQKLAGRKVRACSSGLVHFLLTGYQPESGPTWQGCMVTKSSFSWYLRFIKIDWFKFPIVNVLGIRERNPLRKWAIKTALMRDYSKHGVSFRTPTSCIWFHLQQTKYLALHKYFKYNVPYFTLIIKQVSSALDAPVLCVSCTKW